MDQSVPAIASELAPLQPPSEKPKFPLSLTLTPAQTRELMSERYCHLIGILGAPDAGKTAALVSFYLLAARGRLSDLAFRNSRSLRAFDDISAGARRWNEGQLPEQLTVHTELADDRSAGFLHIRISQQSASRAVDLLLPDLPGEWSSELVDKQREDRLAFLRRADAIWVMVDGVALQTSSTRQYAIHRTKLLLQRIAAFVTPCPRLLLVLSRADKPRPRDATINEIKAEALSLGLTIEVAHIASFAEPGVGTAGDGIPELIERSIRVDTLGSTFWAGERPSEHDADRAMLRSRDHRMHS